MTITVLGTFLYFTECHATLCARSCVRFSEHWGPDQINNSPRSRSCRRRSPDSNPGLRVGSVGRGAPFPLCPRSPWAARYTGASQPPWGPLRSPPRALGPPLPPVDAPRLQVAQRPLIEPQHLLLVGQVRRRRQERHDGRLTFSGRGGSIFT